MSTMRKGRPKMDAGQSKLLRTWLDHGHQIETSHPLDIRFSVYTYCHTCGQGMLGRLVSEHTTCPVLLRIHNHAIKRRKTDKAR